MNSFSTSLLLFILSLGVAPAQERASVYRFVPEPLLVVPSATLSLPEPACFSTMPATPELQYAACIEFLKRYRHKLDEPLVSDEVLAKNVELALAAREAHPWTRDVPWSIFLNDVLPYSVVDEARDPWREDFFNRFSPHVKEATSCQDAVQRINAIIEQELKVSYNIRRLMPHQSPKQSMQLGTASCTGLSILLIDALRAVGIPARMVGVFMWAHTPGNHNWVEVWTGEGWEMTGYGEKDFRTGWVLENCTWLDTDKPINKVWASSWRHHPAADHPDGIAQLFPCVWHYALFRGGRIMQIVDHAKIVPTYGEDVSTRYQDWAKPFAPSIDVDNEQLVHLTVMDRNRKRIPVQASLQLGDDDPPAALGTSPTEGQDVRAFLKFPLPRGKETLLILEKDGKTKEIPLPPTPSLFRVLRVLWD